MNIFELEMLDTPRLAAYCQELVTRIDNQDHMVRLGKCDSSHKKALMAELKKARLILKSRQMDFFNKM